MKYRYKLYKVKLFQTGVKAFDFPTEMNGT